MAEEWEPKRQDLRCRPELFTWIYICNEEEEEEEEVYRLKQQDISPVQPQHHEFYFFGCLSGNPKFQWASVSGDPFLFFVGFPHP